MENALSRVIEFFLLLAVSGMFLNAVVAVKPSDYTMPEVCSGCHAEIYAQWNGTMHSMAHKDPVYQKSFLLASKETNGTFDLFCTKCHAPIAVITGEIPSAENYNVSEVAGKGISCDFCHTVNASSGIGNGAFISSPGKVKYGPFSDLNYSTYHSTAYSELHTRAEFCGMCHDVIHPLNGLVLEYTYSEWKASPYNETTPCQHCHMTNGFTKFLQNPGRAAAGGPVRDHIYTHDFVGGNAMLPELMGSPGHEQLAIKRLQSAAKLEIEKIEMVNQTVNLKVKVTNIGAGHKLPTGLTEARMIWLYVVAKDSVNNMIYSSGERSKEGYIDEKAVKYHTVLGDAKGEPTDRVWFAEKILSDNRIPPKGSSTANYTFTVPANATGKLRVDVKLNYISATQEIADKLFGKGMIIPPSIEMASANSTIDLPAPQATPKPVPGFTINAMIIAITAIYAAIKRSKKS